MRLQLKYLSQLSILVQIFFLKTLLESIPFLVEIRLAVPGVVYVFNLFFNSFSEF